MKIWFFIFTSKWGIWFIIGNVTLIIIYSDLSHQKHLWYLEFFHQVYVIMSQVTRYWQMNGYLVESLLSDESSSISSWNKYWNWLPHLNLFSIFSGTDTHFVALLYENLTKIQTFKIYPEMNPVRGNISIMKFWILFLFQYLEFYPKALIIRISVCLPRPIFYPNRLWSWVRHTAIDPDLPVIVWHSDDFLPLEPAIEAVGWLLLMINKFYGCLRSGK